MSEKVLLNMSNDFNKDLKREIDLGFNINATLVEILTKRGVEYSDVDSVIDQLLKGETVHTPTGYTFNVIYK